MRALVYISLLGLSSVSYATVPVFDYSNFWPKRNHGS